MIAYDTGPEHEFEAERGLPQALPANERIVWQGAPAWRLMAREAMHTRMLSIYFAVLIVWRGVNVLANGGGAVDAAVAMTWLLPLAVMAIAALTLMGWLVARTSVYTITDKRVVMRIGVVLSITFNFPFSKISAAALRAKADGSGDITLSLADTDHIAYVHLWPHARPWKLAHTEPMLRALPDAQAVAQLLATALADVELPIRAARVATTAPAPIALPPLPLAGEGRGEGAREVLASTALTLAPTLSRQAGEGASHPAADSGRQALAA